MQRSRYAHNATFGRKHWRAGKGSAVGRQIGAMTRWFRFYPCAARVCARARARARNVAAAKKGGDGRTRTGMERIQVATKAINAQVSLLPARSAWFRSVHLVGAFRGRTQQGAPCAVSPPPPSLARRQSVTPVNSVYSSIQSVCLLANRLVA